MKYFGRLVAPAAALPHTETPIIERAEVVEISAEQREGLNGLDAPVQEHQPTAAPSMHIDDEPVHPHREAQSEAWPRPLELHEHDGIDDRHHEGGRVVPKASAVVTSMMASRTKLPSRPAPPSSPTGLERREETRVVERDRVTTRVEQSKPRTLARETALETSGIREPTLEHTEEPSTVDSDEPTLAIGTVEIHLVPKAAVAPKVERSAPPPRQRPEASLAWLTRHHLRGLR